jgi:hypothetical protein
LNQASVVGIATSKIRDDIWWKDWIFLAYI